MKTRSALLQDFVAFVLTLAAVGLAESIFFTVKKIAGF
jgi:hypothetical protein